MGKRGPKPVPPEVRFWRFVDKTDGCWLWVGTDNGKYGTLGLSIDGTRTSLYAHRLSYEMHVGPIPEGLTIDHLCRVPLCVNPDHLEAVTQRENSLRGTGVSAVNARKTHCPKGHPLDGLRTSGRRYCKTCARESMARRRAGLHNGPPCSVQNCETTAHARGLCSAHYMRWYDSTH